MFSIRNASVLPTTLVIIARDRGYHGSRGNNPRREKVSDMPLCLSRHTGFFEKN